jgi:type 1 glutamine amidotransferase
MRWLFAFVIVAIQLSPLAAADPKPIRALLVIGGCCHDYAKQQELLTKGISERAHVEWVIAYDPDKTTKHLNPVYEKTTWAEGFDVVVHDECSADVKDSALIERILAPHKEGLPGVVLHCGMHCYRGEGYDKNATAWFDFTGLVTKGHGPQAPIAIKYTDTAHQITKGLSDWTTINEELYNMPTKELKATATALARGKQTVKAKDGTERTDEAVVAWVNTYNGKTRVFATTLGHNNDTVKDARHLDLVTNGLLWSVNKAETHRKVK